MTSFKILSPVAPSIISFLIHFPYSICPFIEALCLFPFYMWICLHSYSWLVCALRSFVRRQHAKLPVRELGAATKLAHTGWLFFYNCSFWILVFEIFWIFFLSYELQPLNSYPICFLFLFPFIYENYFTFDTPQYCFFPGQGPEKAHIVSQLPLVVNYSTYFLSSLLVMKYCLICRPYQGFYNSYTYFYVSVELILTQFPLLMLSTCSEVLQMRQILFHHYFLFSPSFSQVCSRDSWNVLRSRLIASQIWCRNSLFSFPNSYD